MSTENAQNGAIPPPRPPGIAGDQADMALRTARNRASCVAPDADSDHSAPQARPVLSDSGAISARAPEIAPDVVALGQCIHRLELRWLANQSTAPEDEMAGALLAAMKVTPQTVAHVTAGRDPRFLAALLLRGTSRIWADGPLSTIQKP
jgi:hypothetical protein